MTHHVSQWKEDRQKPNNKKNRHQQHRKGFEHFLKAKIRRQPDKLVTHMSANDIRS